MKKLRQERIPLGFTNKKLSCLPKVTRLESMGAFDFTRNSVSTTPSFKSAGAHLIVTELIPASELSPQNDIVHGRIVF